MRRNVMRKPRFELGQVALLDPKSKIWPLIKGSTRPQGTETDGTPPDSSGSATQTASRRRFFLVASVLLVVRPCVVVRYPDGELRTSVGPHDHGFGVLWGSVC